MSGKPISYSEKYNRLQNRAAYANYVIRRQLIQQGELLYLNTATSRSEASAWSMIQEGEVYTRPSELNLYLDQVPGFRTPPTEPVSLVAYGANTQAVVYLIPPLNDGGKEILFYTVTSSPGGISASGLSSPIIISGLTNGVQYTFTATATNQIGTSGSSVPSNSVIPAVTITSFTTVESTSWSAPLGVTSVEYLVVGGGGGAGNGYDNAGGGGGGGGMVLFGTLNVTPGQTYTITVGGGGTGGANARTNNAGTDGSSSIFGSITALGGGSGKGSRTGGVAGAAQVGNITAPTGGTGSGGGNGGKGGGGAGGAGSTNSVATGGTGGIGVSSSLSGSSITYGVGGAGGNAGTQNPGVNGTSNTGNGGRAGGAASESSTGGGNGGSGIVILKY